MDAPPATITTLLPSVARFGFARWVAGGMAVDWPDFYFVRLGNLVALLFAPVAAVCYLLLLAPWVGVRYRLTTRSVQVLHGIAPTEPTVERTFADFDEILVESSPALDWFEAGDLVFRREGAEVLRLEAVPHPETFRRTCLKTRQAVVSVQAELTKAA